MNRRELLAGLPLLAVPASVKLGELQRSSLELLTELIGDGWNVTFTKDHLNKVRLLAFRYSHHVGCCVTGVEQQGGYLGEMVEAVYRQCNSQWNQGLPTSYEVAG